MTGTFNVSFAQVNLLVGDVPGNVRRITAAIAAAREAGADLVVFPELALCGYPPEDLLLHGGLRRQVANALAEVRAAATGIAVLVGYPEYAGGAVYNAAALLADGRLLANYRKQLLPNYSVFDEKRYFQPGDGPVVATLSGVRIGIGICEDLWTAGPCLALRDAGAELIVVPNGSPFEVGKQAQREAVLAGRARETGLPIAYANLVGGQDELVFDGGSCLVDAGGSVRMRAPAFEAGLYSCALARSDGRLQALPGQVEPLLADDASVYGALVLGVRDYVGKNGFRGAVLGLSGGVDSALTLAIAVDALGAPALQAVMMPYRYTAAISLEDAQAQARAMAVDYEVIPIEAMVGTARAALAELFAGRPEDTTEENLQSRCRGMLLMAISNKTGRMVLATGNKSEMAVGYATLYGDMAGGFAPIKDCTKSRVYRLARYRNGIGAVIPERVITREPSAELRPGQKDSDSLPPYAVLDPILDALMLENRSVADISAAGFDPAVVARVVEMVRRAEYKRRQAAPGVRISSRAFGRDWRYPITSGYR
ncbi:MAG: NAD+ synthase [Gammaproteobacteria bacterium]|nr:NAD+ synthase [Gammaproteobacteria bacterium]QOJ30819.1 MAG: NAD+ synthase [Gammaproteobacteria bacterium]